MSEEIVSNEGSEVSDSQVDELLSNEKPSSEIPMTAAPKQAPQEFAIKVNGKEVKATQEQLIQWAQMGYNYPQKAAELNAQQEALQKQIAEREKYLAEMEQKISPYKQVDEFATQNKEWWEHVNSEYQRKAQELKGSEELQRIKQELEDVKKFKSEYVSEKEKQRIAEEDSKLAQEIESIRKSYPNIDFETPDAEGKTLEMKVLEHAVNNDIKSFKTAYRDYYHEHLVGRANEQGKEAAIRDIQKRTKLGILSESSKPTQGLSVASNVKGKSYNQLMQEALEELKTTN